MRFFVGLRPNHGPCVVYEAREHTSCPLDPRFDVRSHSPCGFEWGYCGSGPAQLALAIMCAVTGDEKAAELLYQRFKAQIVAALPKGGWVLDETKIQEWIVSQIGGCPAVKVPDTIELGGIEDAPSTR